ncbi:MAG: hypothetical protein ACI4FZ_11350 [Lachnospiraceae bacterium]
MIIDMSQKTVWKNRIVRLLCVLLIVCTMGADGTQTVFAENAKQAVSELSDGVMKLRADSVEVVLRYGVQGNARYGRNCLMRGSILSEAAYFEGSVEFVLEDTDGQLQSYEVKVKTDADGKGSFFIVLPMHRYLNSVKGRIKSSEEEVLTEREIPLNRFSIGTGSVIGVLGREEASSYDYLSSFGCYVLCLNPEDIADQKEGLDFFDLLILDGNVEQNLSSGQFKAIKDWIMAGGTLAVGTGADGPAVLEALEAAGLYSGERMEVEDVQTCYGMKDEVQQSLNEQILEYEVERSNRYNYLTGYGELKQPKLESLWGRNYIGESMESFRKKAGDTILYATEAVKLCRFVPEHGKMMVAEEGVPLLFTEDYGEGKIEWFTVSLGRKKKDYYGVYFVFLMQQNQSRLGAQRLSALTYNVTEEYTDAVVMDELGKKVSLHIFPYILLFALYLVTVGPGLYLLLKKTGKSVWSFVLTPTLSVVFLLLTYAAGSSTRITKPYIKYTEIVEQSGGKMTAELTMLAAAPTGDDWTLTFRKPLSARLFSKQVNGFGDTMYLDSDYYAERLVNRKLAEVRYGEEQWALEFSDVPPFTEIEARLEYEVEPESMIEDSICLSAEGVKGEVTNVSETAFSEVFLYCNGVMISAGEVEPGETICLEALEQKALMDQWAMSRDYEEFFQEEETTERKLGWSYLYNRLAGKVDEAWFIGITRQASEHNPVVQETEEYTVDGGITLYCLNLEKQQAEEEFCLLTDRDMKVLKGDYSVGDSYRYLGSDILEAEYVLPEGEITAIEFPTFYNREYDSFTAAGFSGTISLYNYETGQYDSFLSDDTDRRITEVAPYLSDMRVLRVRYEKNRLYEGNYMQLPYLAYEWRKGGTADD